MREREREGKKLCQRIQSFLGDGGATDTVCVVCDVERERMIESEFVCVRENVYS